MSSVAKTRIWIENNKIHSVYLASSWQAIELRIIFWREHLRLFHCSKNIDPFQISRNIHHQNDPISQSNLSISWADVWLLNTLHWHSVNQLIFNNVNRMYLDSGLGTLPSTRMPLPAVHWKYFAALLLKAGKSKILHRDIEELTSLLNS